MITERDWENIKQTARREGREEGHREGLKEGRTEGRKEGRAEERLAVSKNLKALGVSLTDIAKATGLTLEEVEAL